MVPAGVQGVLPARSGAGANVRRLLGHPFKASPATAFHHPLGDVPPLPWQAGPLTSSYAPSSLMSRPRRRASSFRRSLAMCLAERLGSICLRAQRSMSQEPSMDSPR